MTEPNGHHFKPQFGQDFSADADPVKRPHETSPHVLVIGAGASGLMSSWILLDHGYKVTIVSREWASFTKAQRLTSQISGALWEFPSVPLGPRTSAANIEESRSWAMASYDVYRKISVNAVLASRFGVKMRKNLCCFPTPIETNEVELERIQAIERSGILDFRHDSELIHEYDNSGFGAVDAFQILAPVIDTDQAMSFLMEIAKNKGADFVSKAIEGDVWENEGTILEKYGVDIIVNASGLDARETASDPNVRSGRGGLLRVVNDGSHFPRIEHAMVVNTEDPEDYSIVFIVPRNDSTLILGTFIEMDEEALDLKIDSPSMVKMREKCERFAPQLKGAQLDPEYGMAQGLRPIRIGDARVQRESRVKDGIPSRVIHAYGHGIGGWTLAFGSAFEVLSLVEEIQFRQDSSLRRSLD